MGPEAVQGFPDQVLRSLSLHISSWHSHPKFADPGVLHELAAAHPQPGPAGCSLWSQLSHTRDGDTGHGVTHSEGPTRCGTARAGRGDNLIPVSPVTSGHRRGPGCAAVAAFKGVYSPSLPPVTPLLSARCQESSKHGLSWSRDLAQPHSRSVLVPLQERWSDPALTLQAGAGEFSQGGFSRTLEMPWVSCREGVVSPAAAPASSWVIPVGSPLHPWGFPWCPVQKSLRAHIAGIVSNKHPPCGDHRGLKGLLGISLEQT